MRFTVSEIARATGARVLLSGEEGALITSLAWDSREVAEGALFAALPGERVDGHDFVARSCAAGARCALASRELPEADLAAVRESGAALLLVDDVATAISELARAWRSRLSGRVIGLTGSNGKTTTKNLVRDVLSRAGSVVATKGNRNNELGVPATLLSADADTDFVVVEMGMRGRGQIAALCDFVRPEWGVVTQLGESHIELLGSRENIARAKAELIEALPEGGVAFLNDACELADFAWDVAGGDASGVTRVRFDGASGESSESGPRVWASDVSLDDEGRVSFTLRASGFPDGRDHAAHVALRLSGLHNASNACAAAAVGLYAGMPLDEVVSALESAQPESGRQEALVARNGMVVINDAYNANPDSMRCALQTFAARRVRGARIAVLGDMGELGDFAAEGHREMGRLVAALGIDELIAVGRLGALIADAALAAGMPASRIVRTENAEEALQEVNKRASSADAVLVKASHSVGLERVVEGLV